MTQRWLSQLLSSGTLAVLFVFVALAHIRQ